MGSGRGGGAGKTRSGFASRINGKGSASGPNKHQHLVPKLAPTKRKPFKAPNIFAEKKEETGPVILIELQQTLLDFYTKAFPKLLDASTVEETLLPIVQEVKGRLFERDFEKAFGKREFLEAYAARWSAARTIGYVDIFAEVLRHVKLGNASSKREKVSEVSDSESGEDEDEGSDEESHDDSHNANNEGVVTKHDQVKFICLGGGAGAELVALTGIHRLVRDLQAQEADDDDNDDEGDDMPQLQRLQLNKAKPVLPIIDLDTVLVDISDWSTVTNALNTTLTSPPQLSAYASASARAAAKPFASPESFTSQFVQKDILDTNFDIETLFSTGSVDQPVIITLMFTLNELYSTSLAGTQRFLLSLTASAPPGALLLIVDSPGSYSTVTLNNNEKQYPMLWLLEHTLFNMAPKSFHAQALAATEIDSEEESTSPQQKRNVRFEEEITPLWGKVKSEESKWCRLPEELNYPIELEDMRYQMHLYRRL